MSGITLEWLKEALSYNLDTGEFNWRVRPDSHFRNASVARIWNKTWAGKPAGGRTDKGYVLINIKPNRYRGHRLAWFYMTGEWPTDEIDHLDGDRSNNRWANLRCASRVENLRNMARPVTNKSGVVGIHFRKDIGRWMASIGVAGKAVYLGCFGSKAAATEARKAAEVQYGFHPNHGREAA